MLTHLKGAVLKTYKLARLMDSNVAQSCNMAVGSVVFIRQTDNSSNVYLVDRLERTNLRSGGWWLQKHMVVRLGRFSEPDLAVVKLLYPFELKR